MRVKCIDADHVYLEAGKVYEVNEENAIGYTLKDVLRPQYVYAKSRFTIVKEDANMMKFDDKVQKALDYVKMVMDYLGNGWASGQQSFAKSDIHIGSVFKKIKDDDDKYDATYYVVLNIIKTSNIVVGINLYVKGDQITGETLTHSTYLESGSLNNLSFVAHNAHAFFTNMKPAVNAKAEELKKIIADLNANLAKAQDELKKIGG